MTSSGGKQHFIVKEAEGITQQPALRTAARGDQRIVVVAAKIGVIRHRHIMVVIDISGRVLADIRQAVASVCTCAA